MANILNDPSIKEMAKNISEDPQFKAGGAPAARPWTLRSTSR